MQVLFCIIFNLFYNLWKGRALMSTQLIKIRNTAIDRSVDLLAELDKNGEVTKIYDYSGNELKINFLRDEVYYKKLWWQFQKKQK
jgi:hypothetical protein